MHINNNQSIYRNFSKFAEFLTYKHDSACKLILKLLVISFNAFIAALIKCFFYISSPVHLRSIKHDLSRMNANPLISRFLEVIKNTKLNDISD